MRYYLLDHPNPYHITHYPRRTRPLTAITMHITAGLEGRPGTADNSAEQTARYAATVRDRVVSWHSGSDTDSFLYLLPASYTAFQVRNYNSSTYGHEISKRTTDWSAPSPRWVEDTLRQAAMCLAPVVEEYNIPLRLATKAELDSALARGGAPVGFVTHAGLDPSRRTDPGLHRGRDTFPWDQFFSYFPSSPSPSPAPTTEWIDAMYILNLEGTPYNFIVSDSRLVALSSLDFWNFAAAGVPIRKMDPKLWPGFVASHEKLRAAPNYGE